MSVNTTKTLSERRKRNTKKVGLQLVIKYIECLQISLNVEFEGTSCTKLLCSEENV